MPFFKYTVANAEGKKLSGTVEAPSEESARTELNNLGFSILVLTQSENLPKINPDHSKFIFEAIDKNSKNITGTIPANTIDAALSKLENEYSLTITAIWPENVSEQEINLAKISGAKRLQNKLLTPKAATNDPQKEENTEFTKEKIENILKQVYELLQKYDKFISKEEKNNINKKIDKLLRIKNSTNLDYILATAEELLNEIKNQEQFLKQKGLEQQQIEIRLKTRQLLNTLHEAPKPKSLSTDIIDKIESWKQKNTGTGAGQFLEKFLNKIVEFLKEPPEITEQKQQIKNYNSQLFDFIKLYFKEPTPEYKEKAKKAMASIYQMRKKAKAELKRLKAKKSTTTKTENINTANPLTSKPERESVFSQIIPEINNLSGWILAFYITYYFISVYLNTKNFGFEPSRAFLIYDSVIFKYLLVLTFLLHSATSIKINFFRNNMTADIILFPAFFFLSILAILNF